MTATSLFDQVKLIQEGASPVLMTCGVAGGTSSFDVFERPPDPIFWMTQEYVGIIIRDKGRTPQQYSAGVVDGYSFVVIRHGQQQPIIGFTHTSFSFGRSILRANLWVGQRFALRLWEIRWS